VAGWAALDIATWRRRRALSLRRTAIIVTATAGVIAVGLVLWSVLGDYGVWWIVGAMVLAAIQVTAAAKATLAERAASHS
jgi:hypothetical protein